jgi:hypothetical protein
MQWFLALAEGCPGFKQYSALVKVAVHTALERTSLRPHFLYDGGENGLTRWLRDREVPIIQCRTFLDEDLARLKGGRDEANTRSTARGILLRLELAQLGQQLGFDDRVLYTDCDVFFRADVTRELDAIACHYFAVAPEFSREEYFHMNTGVMWMNLANLRSVDVEFRAFVRQNLDRLQSLAWDQGAYREFFVTKKNAIKWDKLRPELNWKPYWGDSAEAKIIHFHGPKPFQRPHLDSHYPNLKPLTANGAYDRFCEEWDELLLAAG